MQRVKSQLLTAFLVLSSPALAAQGTVTAFGSSCGHLGGPTLSMSGSPTPGASDCRCVASNVNPNQTNLRSVGVIGGGKGSDVTRKMVILLQAEDAPGKSCDAGETSARQLTLTAEAQTRHNLWPSLSVARPIASRPPSPLNLWSLPRESRNPR